MDTNVALSLETVLLQGVLEFESGSEQDIRAYYWQFKQMLIDGGTLIAGVTMSDPLKYATLILDLNVQPDSPVRFRDLPEMEIGSSVLAIFGKVYLNALHRNRSWARLSDSTVLGSNEIHLTDSAQDWQPGDMIAIATTSKQYSETEYATIEKISLDGRLITIREKLQYHHVAYNEVYGTERFITGAEVAVFYSNIIIRSAISSNFGGRVLFSRRPDDIRQAFTHQLSGILFDNLGGVNGHPAVEFNAIQSSWNQTHLVGCMFRQSRNSALVVRDTDNVLFTNNVIYGTRGTAMKRLEFLGQATWAVNYCGAPEAIGFILSKQFQHTVINNLILSTNCTPHGNVTELKDEASVVDITGATDIRWQRNTVAGATCIGLKTRGSACADYLSEMERDTVIHSCAVGVLGIEPRRLCAQIHHMKIYSSSQVAVFWTRTSAIQAHHIQLVDNSIGFYPVIEQVKRAASFQRANALNIRSCLVVGRSGLQACDGDRSNIMTIRTLSTLSLDVPGHIGVVVSQFLYPVPLTVKNHIWQLNEANWENITFVNFGSWCAKEKDILLSSDMTYRNSLQTAVFKTTTVMNVPRQNIVRYRHQSSAKDIFICGDMECDSPKKVLVTDVDGGLFGKPAVALPKAINTNMMYNFVKHNIPLRRRLTRQGTNVDFMKSWPFFGIVRDEACVLGAAKQAYICPMEVSHRMLLIQPINGKNPDLKRVGAAVLTTELRKVGFIDLVSGRLGCVDAECKQGQEVFPLIVTNRSTFSVYFTRDNPDALHLRLADAKDDYRVHLRLDYRQAARLDVFVNSEYVLPQNGVLNDQGQVVLDADMPHGQALPDVNKHPIGTNYYDPDEQLLYLVVGGSRTVEVHSTSYLKLSLTVDGEVLLDAFYLGYLRTKLAKYLGLLQSQVVVTRPAAEALYSERSRRVARSANPSTVQLDVIIAQPPQINETDNRTALDLSRIEATLNSTLESGKLDQVLNVSIATAQLKAILTEKDRALRRPRATPSYYLDDKWELIVQPPSNIFANIPFVLIHGIRSKTNSWISVDNWSSSITTHESEYAFERPSDRNLKHICKMNAYKISTPREWHVNITATSRLFGFNLTVAKIFNVLPTSMFTEDEAKLFKLNGCSKVPTEPATTVVSTEAFSSCARRTREGRFRLDCSGQVADSATLGENSRLLLPQP
ncbi:unnamed protein product [Echinostoma caproni]|uniref:Beta_helix domain-containing protein n=1 Tax=Echinostoma caproni TaxID=27848 RepID=A0A183A9T6_9TREM|nr:unnamed protein product [Echinostoma caproni]